MVGSGSLRRNDRRFLKGVKNVECGNTLNVHRDPSAEVSH